MDLQLGKMRQVLEKGLTVGYLHQLAGSGSPVGAPPGGRNIGAPPPPQSHIEPAPYDAAKDPTWKTMLAHGGEEFRNFLNGLDDGTRQMLHGVLQSLQKANPLSGAVQALQGANPLQQAAQALSPPPPPGPVGMGAAPPP